jgi:3-oxoacyl-[acyl-carrier-protein] synthase-3
MTIHAAITGWGMSVPVKVVTNADIAKIVDTSDEWIQTRTGIRERRIISGDESTSSLATAAGRDAMQMAGVTANDIDMVIVATFCPTAHSPRPPAVCKPSSALAEPPPSIS